MLIYVHLFVSPAQTCLEQSIFILLGHHIALSEHTNSSQSGKQAVREQSEHQNQGHVVGAYKHFVLFFFKQFLNVGSESFECPLLPSSVADD